MVKGKHVINKGNFNILEPIIIKAFVIRKDVIWNERHG